MKKNYVLDTNVLLHDPQSIFKFEDNNLVVPIFVIEEIDNFKKEPTERGRNARQVTRYLDGLREKYGSLAAGVGLPSGGALTVAVPREKRNQPTRDSHMQDIAILEVAMETAGKDPSIPTIFVSMDTNLRIRADALGLKTENYDAGRVEVSAIQTGILELEVDQDLVGRLFSEALPKNQLPQQPYANQCIMLVDRVKKNHTALGIYDAAKESVIPLRVPREGVWGIKPRNREQNFAFHLLLSDGVKLVTLLGKAGTGKTLLAVAAGLHKTVDESVYLRMLVARPVMPLGRDIGYLPGDVEEKLQPWMQPIFDNVELILSRKSEKQPRRQKDDDRRFPSRYHPCMELIEQGIMEIEPLTYIRGRSLPNQYLIVDEAQNLTPHEVKTIITRCGDNTKIVMTGDPYQIDNPYVDSESNGLAFVAERFRGEPAAGHVVLTKGERSDLAEMAANLL
jgi:PhoH-like ATPase